MQASSFMTIHSGFRQFCVSFLGLEIWGPWIGYGFVFAFSLLDAVDGNIARTTGNVTYYGKFLDGLLGEVIEASYCFCIGIGLSAKCVISQNEGIESFSYIGFSMPIICGAVILGGRLVSSFVDLKYEYHLSEREKGTNKAIQRINSPIQTSIYKDLWYYQAFVNLNLLNNQLIILAIVLSLNITAYFLYILSIYYVLRAVTYFVFYLRRAKRNLC